MNSSLSTNKVDLKLCSAIDEFNLGKPAHRLGPVTQHGLKDPLEKTLMPTGMGMKLNLFSIQIGNKMQFLIFDYLGFHFRSVTVLYLI